MFDLDVCSGMAVVGPAVQVCGTGANYHRDGGQLLLLKPRDLLCSGIDPEQCWHKAVTKLTCLNGVREQ